MAFINVPTGGGEGGGGGDHLPIFSYNAKAGRLFTSDRTQEADGWVTVKTDVTMKQPAFAIDLAGSLEVGWAHFASGTAPVWCMVPYGSPMPPRPLSPGNDEKGKAIQFKTAFRTKVIGKDIGGVREFGGTAAVLLGAMNELHSAWEASPEGKAGKIPLVKMTDVLEVKSGMGSNFAPVFTVQSYVDRPAILGDKAAPAAAAPAAPAATKHVGPPPATNGHAAPAAPEEMPF